MEKLKTYTVTEKSWIRQAGRGTSIGSEFLDHGKLMRIISIAVVYRRDGEKDKLIDIVAAEIPRTA
jgi:hypothetical protein